MGLLLSRVSSVARPARVRAGAADTLDTMYKAGGYYPPDWFNMLSSAGITVTPELAMTLSAWYSGVTTIADDISAMPAQTFRALEDGGKERVRTARGGIDVGGIGSLSYRLRWQPNPRQTAKQFFACLVAQYLLRSRCYAELKAGPSGFADQLLPRHPDRVEEYTLPSGRLQFKIREPNGEKRPVAQDEMFFVHDESAGGIKTLSRVSYGANAIGTSLAAEHAAGRFFKSGMTAALVASHPGELDEEEEKQLHGSISRFAAGAENSFGLMLVEQDIKIDKLGIEPEKAQMMLARNFGIKEVARMLKLPGHKLEAEQQTQAYAAREQANLEYVIGCLRPIIIAFEQSIQRDLILSKESFFVEFLIEALLRGDLAARAEYYEKAIRNRWMRPSEVRLRENMNPDPELDRLSERDFQPGQTGGRRRSDRSADDARAQARVIARAGVLGYETGLRIVRKERAAVEKAAKQYANDGEGWSKWLRTFYDDHAGYVAQTLKVPIAEARAYAAEHGELLEQQGIAAFSDDWDTSVASELGVWALEGRRAA